jgi:hypothetical protein
VVVDEEGLPWALFGLVEGEHYDFGRLAHAREAGRLLAEFHDVTDRIAEAPRYHLDVNLRRFVAAPREIADGLRRDFGSAELEPDSVDTSGGWRRSRRRSRRINLSYAAGRRGDAGGRDAWRPGGHARRSERGRRSSNSQR